MNQYIHATPKMSSPRNFHQRLFGFEGRRHSQLRAVSHVARKYGDWIERQATADKSDETDSGHDLVDPVPQPYSEPRFRGHISPSRSEPGCWATSGNPRSDADLNPSNHLQAIANTAGFHFATIEQGGTSLYPSLAQRVSSSEVLQIVLGIGGTEAMHFQTGTTKQAMRPIA